MPEYYGIALEASDRLIDILSQLEVYLWMYFKADLQTQCLFAWKSKEISQDLRKIIVDLHKSGSSLAAISKRLKVLRSSIQTIVHVLPSDVWKFLPRMNQTCGGLQFFSEVLADFFWFSHDVKQRGTEFEGRPWNTSTGTPPIDSNDVN